MTSKDLLSAEKILELSRKRSQIPATGGLKDHQPERGNLLQEKRLNASLKLYNEVVHEERVCKRMNLTVADWDSNRNIAIAVTLKGNALKKHGWQTKEGAMFHPEETLFLVEQGVMELHKDNVVLSLEDVYMLTLPVLESFEYYQVYAYLCRLGYLVQRYKKRQEADGAKRRGWGERAPSPEPCGSPSTNNDDDDDVLRNGPIKELWSDSCDQPIVKPQHATSTGAILCKLRITEQGSMKSVRKMASCEEESNFRIVFDVFIPKGSKKLDTQALPRFRIALFRFDDRPPSLRDIAYLSRQSEDVGVKLAVVQHGSVAFYGFFGVDIPSMTLPG